MSQGVIHAGVLYTSGQVDAEGADVATQTKNILAKIDNLLAQAGSTKADVISANVWLDDIGSFDEMNRIWEQWIDPKNPPTRATVESKLAGTQYKVEIAMIAVARRP
jgi:enamine deaminase RidA (YjgF/YER057c/UK114 family)